jgi:hypothetical protein
MLAIFLDYTVNRNELLLARCNLTRITDVDASNSVPASAGAGAGAAATKPVDAKAAGALAASTSDGLDEVERASQLRFTEDDRVHEVPPFQVTL